MHKVAIVILNYMLWKDTIEEIRICTEVLSLNNTDIIVVDNCSPNDSVKILEKQSKENGFVFLYSPENKGYGAGNNIGMRYALQHGYEYAFILNNDIIINDPKLMIKLLAVFDADDKVAVVNPDIYSPEGHLFNRDAVKPSFFDYTLGLQNYKKKGRKLNEINGLGYGYVYRPQGCCMMVDLSKMKEVDFFDENTFLYCEESILAERLLKKGYLCACNMNTSIVHNHSKTVKNTFDINRIIGINNKNFAYYLREYRRFPGWMIRICCAFNALKIRILERQYLQL